MERIIVMKGNNKKPQKQIKPPESKKEYQIFEVYPDTNRMMFNFKTDNEYLFFKK